MQKIELMNLYEMDYNLGNVFAMQQFWRENTNFKMNVPRKTSCLLYFCGGYAKYVFGNGEKLSVPNGSVLYIPEGCTYKTNFFKYDNNLPTTILIEFNLLLEDGKHFCVANKPTILRQESNVHIEKAFNEVAELYSSAVIPLSKIKSIIYGLLSDMSFSLRQQNIYSKDFHTIAKGISYLENDLKSEKTVAQLAQMCHVSESTFRRLFKEYTGKTPIEYRIERRIEYAKKLLNTGSMTVVEVALETGFVDPAYFCRVFKKQMGITAGEYLRNLEI
ncbi:MAG: helix-turn-helix transcriptional regulator [Clostridia bacterium]|nr:helix-turn-helix transcriptional regulator [Clostridia bacterium]